MLAAQPMMKPTKGHTAGALGEATADLIGGETLDLAAEEGPDEHDCHHSAPGLTDHRYQDQADDGLQQEEHNNDCRTAAEFHSLEGIRGTGGFLIQPVSGVHHRVSGVLGNPLGIPQYKQHGNGAEHQEDDKPYKEAGIEFQAHGELGEHRAGGGAESAHKVGQDYNGHTDDGVQTELLGEHQADGDHGNDLVTGGECADEAVDEEYHRAPGH